MFQFLFRNKKRAAVLLDPDEILVDSVSILGQGEYMEGKLERPLGRMSSFIFLFFMGGVFIFLISYAALLHIRRGDELFIRSQENRFFVRTILAPRGIIYDSSREPFVRNEPTFGILFERDAFRREGGGAIAAFMEHVRTVFGEKSDIPERFDFLKESTVLSSLQESVVIAREASSEDVVAVVAHSRELPGLKIFEGFRRNYADPNAYSHLLGFVGKASEEDLDKKPYLFSDVLIGKNGVESMYDAVLLGRQGKKIVEMDSLGRESRFKLIEKPQEGKSIVLTVDRALQSAAYEIFHKHIGEKRAGSVVILDASTGAVRALVSYPGFDSNKFGRTLLPQEFERVLDNPLKPLFNRSISGEFPAGSTIKPILAAAALEERIIDPRKQIYDKGFIEIQNPYNPDTVSVFKDWKKHGWIDFYDAIAVSANVYFYMIGGGFEDQKGLGINRIKRYAEKFGLGSRLGIDLAGESPGLFPGPETKKILEPRDPVWRIGDTYNASIGQGEVRVTPLQVASFVAAIANGGTLYRPYILKEILDSSGVIEKKVDPQPIREGIVSAESLRHVKLGMRRTVTFGTAGKLSDLPVAVAAKTGTAQAGSGKPHAWVTGFAPYENPEIAFAVMVEHAGEGTTEAMPITRDILDWYFTKKLLKN